MRFARQEMPGALSAIAGDRNLEFGQAHAAERIAMRVARNGLAVGVEGDGLLRRRRRTTAEPAMDVLDRSVGGRLPRHRACFVEGVPAAADAVAILLAADDLPQFGGAVRRPGAFPASIQQRVRRTVGMKAGPPK